MVELTEKERIEILMILGYGDRRRTFEEVCRIFNQQYPNRSPIVKSTVCKILKKFNATGNVKDIQKSGRPKTQTSSDKALDILLSIEENPHLATRTVALDHGTSHMSVQRILNRKKFHPFKVTLVQEFLEDDFDRRLEFCDRMMEFCNNFPNIINTIVFSDEATFSLNGTINRHNCRYWARENPHWMREHHTQFPHKINVWAGILGQQIIGPFILVENLTGPRYLQLLRNNVIPALVAVAPNPCKFRCIIMVKN